MKYVFIVDSGETDGVGHIMRTLPLAEELKKRNHQVIYVGSNEFPFWIKSKLKEIHIQIEVLSEFELKDLSEDAIFFLDSYSKTLIDGCIDSHSLRKIVRVSDNYTPLFNCNFNINISVSNEVIEDDKSTSGTKYFPIRNGINKITDLVKLQDLPVISVVAGGNDGSNFQANLSKILTTIKSNFKCNFFINQDLNLASNFAEDTRFNFFPIGTDLDRVGNTSNLAFVTASTTAVEFAARGCVTGIISVAENQSLFETQLIHSGLAMKIGTYSDEIFLFDKLLISNLIEDKYFRIKNMPSSQLDNMGPKRIIDKIERFFSGQN